MGGETAGGHGAEAVGDGVEQGHTGEPVGRSACHGNEQVQVPQRLGGFGDARGQLGVLHRPRNLRFVQLHAPDAQHGQDRHRQHDNAHAAKPLQLLAVIENRFWQRIQTGKHRGAGGGQAGHGFKHRVGETHRSVGGNQKRQAANHAQYRPEQRHHQEAVTGLQFGAMTEERQPQHQAEQQRDHEGGQERPFAAVLIEVGHRHRWHHGETEHHQQQAEHFGDQREMHGVPSSMKKGAPAARCFALSVIINATAFIRRT